MKRIEKILSDYEPKKKNSMSSIESWIFPTDEIISIANELKKSGMKIKDKSRKQIILSDKDTDVYVKLTNHKDFPIGVSRYPAIDKEQSNLLNVASELTKIAKELTASKETMELAKEWGKADDAATAFYKWCKKQGATHKTLQNVVDAQTSLAMAYKLINGDLKAKENKTIS